MQGVIQESIRCGAWKSAGSGVRTRHSRPQRAGHNRREIATATLGEGLCPPTSYTLS
jgi:hypothetical protein